ncbi:uncharacterized protein LOC108668056 [Hyalella azteca]|uniref:Uncharacterized protein LOC108668056 n=1 Tax=Hyalella azteca TaxID=294128 RepID=A0A8B7NAQ6_HYAAZ|nr:uncharacterized protein LOC108668056 [Hyalella azteca]
MLCLPLGTPNLCSQTPNDFDDNTEGLHTPKHISEGYQRKAMSPESNTLDANVSFGVPCSNKINIVLRNPMRNLPADFEGNSSTSGMFSSNQLQLSDDLLNKEEISNILPDSPKSRGDQNENSVNVLLDPSPTAAAIQNVNNAQLSTNTSVEILGLSLDLDSSTGFSSLLSSVVGPPCPSAEPDSSLLNTPSRLKHPTPSSGGAVGGRPCTPSSPSRFVPRDDWLSGAADFSLTGLFDSIDPPLKGAHEDPQAAADPQQTVAILKNPRAPSTTLLGVLNENGVDFTAKFDALTSSQNAESSH